uniref:Orf284 n=1 Tax=Amoebidium parasiticum TaxID=4881 RepID=Q8M0C1_AMOPA|nr:Orf284 [Amoebidium parasiticum]
MLSSSCASMLLLLMLLYSRALLPLLRERLLTLVIPSLLQFCVFASPTLLSCIFRFPATDYFSAAYLASATHLIVISSMHFSSFLPIFLSFLSSLSSIVVAHSLEWRLFEVASFIVASFVKVVTATSFMIAATASPLVIIRYLIVISSMNFYAFLPIFLSFLSCITRDNCVLVASFVVASFVKVATATSFVIAATAFPFVIIRYLIVISSMHFYAFLPIFLSYIIVVAHSLEWRLSWFSGSGIVAFFVIAAFVKVVTATSFMVSATAFPFVIIRHHINLFHTPSY